MLLCKYAIDMQVEAHVVKLHKSAKNKVRRLQNQG